MLGDFEKSLVSSDHRLALCILLILTWIAASDGNVARDVEADLRELASRRKLSRQAGILLNIVRKGRTDDLQLACEIVRLLDKPRARLFLTIATGVAMRGGRLNSPENHILRFLVDLLGIGQAALDEIYDELTGADFPQPDDPSSRAWWRVQALSQLGHTAPSTASSSDPDFDPPCPTTAGSPASPSNHASTPAAAPAGAAVASGAVSFAPNLPPEADAQRRADLARLGLHEDASHENIKEAYLRLSHTLHPARFKPLGPEVEDAAKQLFRKIQHAFDRLCPA